MPSVPIEPVAEDFDEGRAACLGCRRCGLADRRTQVVLGEGDRMSRLVLIGEGPGDQEDRTGRPFVGRAGHLLDRALVDAGLTRDEIYITNTVKCRAADWSTGKPLNRAPTSDEVATCRPWLRAELSAIRPHVILCIGAPSAKNLIRRNFRITQERGQFFPCELAAMAMATLHPSYILRQQSATKTDGGYADFVDDIRNAADQARRLAWTSPPSTSR